MPPDSRKEDVPDGFVAIGRVLGAWGVRGDLKVEPLADKAIFSKGRTVRVAGRETTIERSRATGRVAHLKLSGIDYRDQAAAVAGEYIIVPEADLPALGEDEYYRYQLIGLRVVTTEGETLGEIAEIFATASNDVYVVRGPRGETLIPAVEDVVQSIDIAAGVVTIEAIPGLLPDTK